MEVIVPTPVERALMAGDARDLSPADRVLLLRQLVDDAALRWGGSPPVQFISDGKRLVPYITKAGADQLAAVRGASIVSLDVTDSGSTIDVTAVAKDADGRTNTDVGSCEYADIGKSRARARMVAATRARRRTILGLLGSGFAWSEAGDRDLGLEDDAP
jgi:hypothetical protein